MPKVGGANFPYTSKGVRDAQAHAKNTGQKVQMMKKGGKVASKMGGGMMKKDPMAMGYKDGGSKKDTHVTKDGRTVKKGLYYYMNRAKKRGTSKPGKGTVTDKALKQSAKTAKKPAKKSG